MNAAQSIANAIKEFNFRMQDKVENIVALNVKTKIGDHEFQLYQLGLKIDACKIQMENAFDRIILPYSKIVEPRIPWKVQSSNDMHYTYTKGSSPWEFTLKSDVKLSNLIYYCKPSEDASELFSNILSIPNTGTLFLVKQRSFAFRGMYLEFTGGNRLLVLDIDEDITYLVDRDDIFYMPEVLKKIPAATLRCCLTHESVGRSKWTSTLTMYFKEIMKQLTFTIKTLEQVSLTYPPRYKVTLYGHVEDGLIINVSRWFTGKVRTYLIGNENREEMFCEEILDFFNCGEDVDTPSHPESIEYRIEKINSMLQDKMEKIVILQNQLIATPYKMAKSFQTELCHLGVLIEACGTDLAIAFDSITLPYFEAVDVRVCWKVQSSSDIHYTYVGGSSPWDFTLAMKSDAKMDEKDLIHYCIPSESASNEFSNLPFIPSTGELFLVKQRRCAFRGMYLGFAASARVRMLNVDTDIEHRVNFEDVYFMPNKLKDIPPTTLRCCLTKESFGRSKWTSPLNMYFKEIMRQLTFTIKIVEQVSLTYPPRYEVCLHGHVEDDLIIDVSRWFFEKVVSYVINTEVHEFKFCVDSLDIYNWVKDTTTVVREIEDDSKNANSSGNLEATTVFLEIKDDFINAVSSKNSAATMVVQKKVRDYGNSYSFCNSGHSIDIATASDMAEIGEKYEDEVPVCKFFDRCPKIDCNREHIDPGYFGYVYTFLNCFKELELPAENEIISLVPVNLISGHVFYAHISGEYDPFAFTLRLAEQRMNNRIEISRYRTLDLLPELGELVLAYSPNKKQWFRGRVTDVYERDAEVASIDYGWAERVSLHALRKMNIDLLCLPPQAVRCVLYKNVTHEKAEQEVMYYLKKLFMKKKLTAMVNESFPGQMELEITIFLPNGMDLNTLLINKGYCYRV